MISMEEEEEQILIRCDKELARVFKLFVADRRFKAYRDALRWLLDRAGYWPREFTLRVVGEAETKRVKTRVPLGEEVKTRVAEE